MGVAVCKAYMFPVLSPLLSLYPIHYDALVMGHSGGKNMKTPGLIIRDALMRAEFTSAVDRP